MKHWKFYAIFVAIIFGVYGLVEHIGQTIIVLNSENRSLTDSELWTRFPFLQGSLLAFLFAIGLWKDYQEIIDVETSQNSSKTEPKH